MSSPFASWSSFLRWSCDQMDWIVWHHGDLLYHRFAGKARPAFTLWECRQIDRNEPILQPNPEESPLAYPYCNKELGLLVDTLRDSHWRNEEINMMQDIFDYEKMDDSIRTVLDTNLRFFAVGDNFVVENLLNQFARRITLPVATTFYAFQIANEEEHKLTYGRQIHTMIADEAKRTIILDADNEPALKLMADWIREMILNERSPIPVRLLSFVFVEGVIFTSSFAFIFWLRSQNLCPGLGKANEFISRDENLHAIFALTLYKLFVRRKLNRAELEQLVHSAMTICDLFVETMFRNDSVQLPGMNQKMMKIYVRHVANVYFNRITGTPIYENVYNPFPSSLQQSMDGKTNFFESDVSEYKKSINVHPEQYSENLEF